MHTVRYFLFSIAFLGFMGMTHAQENATETVTVEGVGKTEASAKKAAFREAIQKVVGVLIDAKTLVKNEEIIKDEVLEYSGGFISKSEILSSMKDEEGLVRVKVKCVVEKTQVKKKLADIKVLVVNVDGAGFAEKEMSKEELRKDAAKFISKALEERKKIYTIYVPEKLDGLKKNEAGYIYVPVAVNFDPQKYKDWVKNWIPVFDKMQSAKMTGLSLYKKVEGSSTKLEDENNPVRPKAWSGHTGGNKREFFFLSVAESLANNGTTKWSAYKFECDMTKIKGLKLRLNGDDLILDTSSNAKLRLEFQNSEGDTLAGSEASYFGPIKGRSSNDPSDRNNNLYVYNPEQPDYAASSGEGGGQGLPLRLVSFPHSYQSDGLELPPFPGEGVPGEYGCIFKLKIPREDYAKIAKIVAKLEWNDVETKGGD